MTQSLEQGKKVEYPLVARNITCKVRNCNAPALVLVCLQSAWSKISTLSEILSLSQYHRVIGFTEIPVNKRPNLVEHLLEPYAIVLDWGY